MSEKKFIDLRTASRVHIEHGTNFIFIEMDDVQIAVSNQMAQSLVKQLTNVEIDDGDNISDIRNHISPLTKVQDMGNST